MIIAVTAAPSRVPATPKREVTKAAVAEANPAAITCVPLTMGACLAASLTLLTLPTNPRGFKEKWLKIWRTSPVCRGFHTAPQCGGGQRPAVRIPRTAMERRRMAKAKEGKFSELFEVIQDYANREYDYQDKALQVLAGSYTFMFESEDMPDARGVVD